MKKIIIITSFLKWVLAAVGAVILFYTGWNIYNALKPTVYKGADGKQSDFEKSVPNIAEGIDKLTYQGEYKGEDGVPSTFEKYFPNVAEAVDVVSSWFGSPKK